MVEVVDNRHLMSKFVSVKSEVSLLLNNELLGKTEIRVGPLSEEV